MLRRSAPLVVFALATALIFSGCVALTSPRIDPVGAVSGTVVDANNKPVVGAIVAVGPWTATTDSDGVYRILGIRHGDYTLEVQLLGTVVFSAEIVVGSGELKYDVAVPAQYTVGLVQGTVRDVNGLPLGE